MQNNNLKTHLAVIGGGPGGYAAAFLAADLGMDVTLIDPAENPGGVCLYRGCIPSKALLHVAKLLAETQDASRWGIRYAKPQIDLEQLREWKESVVQRLTGGLGQLSRQRKIQHIRGRAVFQDRGTLEITLNNGEKQSLVFDYAILATGSRPAQVPGLSLDSPAVINSTGALQLPDIPRSLLVIGGGYIGLEMGTVYAALGSEVTVIEMMPGLLPGADRDLVKYVHKRLEQKFAGIWLNSRVKTLSHSRAGVKVTFEDAEQKVSEKVFEKVLIAVGRKPNSEGIGLENTAVEVDRRGFVKVDAQRRTAEPRIYAIGDVVGEPMLAHKASHEGRTAVEAIAGHKVAFEPRAIPAVVFTDPELAWTGLTETEAKAQNRQIEVVRFPWAASGRALTMDRPDGLTKMIIDPETERVLGVGIVGSGAGELIGEATLAIEMAATATDIKLTIHPHPTLSETIMESAEMFFGQSTHVYRPKRR